MSNLFAGIYSQLLTIIVDNRLLKPFLKFPFYWVVFSIDCTLPKDAEEELVMNKKVSRE